MISRGGYGQFPQPRRFTSEEELVGTVYFIKEGADWAFKPLNRPWTTMQTVTYAEAVPVKPVRF